MCGIAGIFDHKNKIFVDDLQRMKASLLHRGPDDNGIYIDNNVGLAHTRLSIIDLSRNGHQPMLSEDGNLAIVYNGEIYNYREIRSELEAQGHRFFSNSDTEVILKSYAAWQEKCLDKFRGMFAFGIFDKKKKELFLARDRFGIKPLYYYSDKDRFIFSSEIKSLLASGKIDKRVNHQGISSFLSLGYVLPPVTIYQGISALEPGHFMKVSEEGSLKDDKYYDLSQVFAQKEARYSSFEDAAAKTNRVLLDSLRHHLISDVKVGIFLSGGIDSSSLVSLAKDAGHKNIQTVSVVFSDELFNEAKYANLIARLFGTEHAEVKVEWRDIVDNLDDFFSYMDQPTVDGINTYFVSLAAKKAGLKTILSGIGGDEIFGGYPSFEEVPRLHKFLKIGKYLPSSFSSLFAPERKREKLKNMLRQKRASFSNAYLYYRSIFTSSQIHKILDPDLIPKNSDPAIEDGILGNIKINFNKVSFLESYFYMRGQLLRDADLFSMRHSLEIRVPFVDHKVVECVAAVPTAYKQRRGAIKRLLVGAAGKLPDEIANRRKQDFTFPFENWLKQDMGREIMLELRRSKIMDQKHVEELINGFMNKKVHWSRIWTLFVLERFLK